MQIVKKATVRKMIVDGRLYGRIQCVVPGWLVGKEVMVIIWTEPTIEEATLRKKGVKLWRQDEQGNIVEVIPENVKLPKPKPKEEKQEEAGPVEKPVEVKPETKQEEKPIEEIEIKPEEEKPGIPPEVMAMLERIKKERFLSRGLRI